MQRDAPLGTYLGWNITAEIGDVGFNTVASQPFRAGLGCNYAGGVVPCFRAKALRLTAGDPRLSLEERDGDHAGHVAAITPANNAFSLGYLLVVDRDALIAQALASDLLH